MHGPHVKPKPFKFLQAVPANSTAEHSVALHSIHKKHEASLQSCLSGDVQAHSYFGGVISQEPCFPQNITVSNTAIYDNGEVTDSGVTGCSVSLVSQSDLRALAS